MDRGSWIYLLAIAILKGDTSNVEKGAGMRHSVQRYRETIHACLSAFHNPYPELEWMDVMHIFHVLQCMLHEDTVDVVHEDQHERENARELNEDDD